MVTHPSDRPSCGAPITLSGCKTPPHGSLCPAAPGGPVARPLPRAPVAQRIEHRFPKPVVTGSNPVRGDWGICTKARPVAMSCTLMGCGLGNLAVFRSPRLSACICCAGKRAAGSHRRVGKAHGMRYSLRRLCRHVGKHSTSRPGIGRGGPWPHRGGCASPRSVGNAHPTLTRHRCRGRRYRWRSSTPPTGTP